MARVVVTASAARDVRNLSPWRWMIVIYERDREADVVVILRVVDGRTSSSPTANR